MKKERVFTCIFYNLNFFKVHEESFIDIKMLNMEEQLYLYKLKNRCKYKLSCILLLGFLFIEKHR